MAKTDSEQASRIIIRAATGDDASAVAAVHVASWREVNAGLMPQTMLTSLAVSDRTVRWKHILDQAEGPDRPGVFVAEHGGDLVGFASSGSQRDPNLLAQGFTGETRRSMCCKTCRAEAREGA